ncbi:MAG: serine hydrolase, partial [Candidatus Levybacteria bacterium]|nr:serine hydrolase [Candidatus Levybacteria bacterium]
MIERDYSLNYHVGYSNTKKTLLKKIVFWLSLSFVLLVAFLFIKNIFFKSNDNTLAANQIISPLAKVTESVLAQNDSSVLDNEGLKNVVETSLEGTTAKYGIAIINLKSGQQYFYNEHKRFESASLYKLWVMAVVFQWIEKRKLSLDD